MSIRILLADDHDDLRHHLRRLLEASGRIVCAEASDGHAAVAMARDWKPDIAVLDLSMPGLNGMAAAAAIRSVAPRLPIVILTLHPAPPAHDATVWLDKARAAETLLPTVLRLHTQLDGG